MFVLTNRLPHSLRFQILTDFSPLPNNGSRSTIEEKSNSFVANVFVVHFACAQLEKLLTKLRYVFFLLAFLEAEAADVCILCSYWKSFPTEIVFLWSVKF